VATRNHRSSFFPEDNLNSYFRRIRTYPMLEPGEEVELARRWRDHHDSEAMEKMVTSHLRLVAKIAMGYRGYGLPVADLIAEGNVGMMQAVNKFDPERGFRLATYAMWWIRASIQEYVLHSWSLVKMGTTAAQKKLFFNLRKLKAYIGALDEGDMKPEQVRDISLRLQVSETEVINMNRRLGGGDHSLNAPLREEGEGEWQDWLVEASDDQETMIGEAEELNDRRGLLMHAMKGLSKRERHIISERRMKDQPSTLQTLSDQYGVSRERIRQIEVRAFEKLRKTVRNAVIDQRVMH
jgi:RNA polymerase sigma-32 factor